MEVDVIIDEPPPVSMKVRSYSMTPRPPNLAATDQLHQGHEQRGSMGEGSCLLFASSLLLSSITPILSPLLRSLCLSWSDPGWTQRRQSSSEELRLERVERHLQAFFLVLHFPHGHRNNPPADQGIPSLTICYDKRWWWWTPLPLSTEREMCSLSFRNEAWLC